MIITEKLLNEKGACVSGIRWFRKWGGDCELIPVLNGLIADNQHDYANWLIVRCMAKHQYVSYAIFAAEQVIEIYEKEYPSDDRPRKAIEAAKECLAAYASASASAAAYSAYAAYSADASAAAYRKELKEKILRYGISIL